MTVSLRATVSHPLFENRLFCARFTQYSRYCDNHVKSNELLTIGNANCYHHQLNSISYRMSAQSGLIKPCTLFQIYIFHYYYFFYLQHVWPLFLIVYLIIAEQGDVQPVLQRAKICGRVTLKCLISANQHSI